MSDTLEWIYRGHRRRLYTVALAITHSAADAEDAVHEAFARLCRSPLASNIDPVAYVFTAVRNAALDGLRRQKAAASKTASMALMQCLESSSPADAAHDRNQTVAAAVDDLPEDLRSVVIFRVFGGLTFRQVSEVTDVPLQTLVSRYKTALERLRPRLKDLL